MNGQRWSRLKTFKRVSVFWDLAVVCVCVWGERSKAGRKPAYHNWSPALLHRLYLHSEALCSTTPTTVTARLEWQAPLTRVINQQLLAPSYLLLFRVSLSCARAQAQRQAPEAAPRHLWLGPLLSQNASGGCWDRMAGPRVKGRGKEEIYLITQSIV